MTDKKTMKRYQWIYNKPLYFIEDRYDIHVKDIRKHDRKILGGKFLAYLSPKIHYEYQECSHGYEHYVLYLDSDLYEKYHVFRNLLNLNHNIRRMICDKCVSRMVRINYYSVCDFKDAFFSDLLEEEFDREAYIEFRRLEADYCGVLLADVAFNDIYEIIEKTDLE